MYCLLFLKLFTNLLMWDSLFLTESIEFHRDNTFELLCGIGCILDCAKNKK